MRSVLGRKCIDLFFVNGRYYDSLRCVSADVYGYEGLFNKGRKLWFVLMFSDVA